MSTSFIKAAAHVVPIFNTASVPNKAVAETVKKANIICKNLLNGISHAFSSIGTGLSSAWSWLGNLEPRLNHWVSRKMVGSYRETPTVRDTGSRAYAKLANQDN